MRKILLATSAMIAFAGAAQAADAPITVNLGGYVDFRAAHFHEATGNFTTADPRRDHDFETEFRLNVSAEGKAANGIEYGGLVSMWNGPALGAANGNDDVRADQAYVWMSGAWGKLILGDDHGASDLFVYAPTIGEGQIDGTYTDFTDPTTLMVMQPSYIDPTENATKVTYYTPKVGNEMHKLQLGASFAPNLEDNGQNVIKYSTTAPTYQDYIEATAQYTGNWNPVNTVISGMLATGARDRASTSLFGANLNNDFTALGVGAQAMYAGFTFGGSYMNAGRFNTVKGQNKTQDVWTLGGKYEFDKVALAINGLSGRGYNNAFVTAGTGPDLKHQNYVKDFKALGLGASYTWFPGLTSAFDTVLFSQDRDDTIGGNKVKDNDGHVIMLSQKITF